MVGAWRAGSAKCPLGPHSEWLLQSILTAVDQKHELRERAEASAAPQKPDDLVRRSELTLRATSCRCHTTRVYSFGASGAALSQYVVWAREARERWQAQVLAIVVVGNDFDESLASFHKRPGFHHYVEEPSGSLRLQRFDYEPSHRRELVRRSALARYVFFNLQLPEQLRRGVRPAVPTPVDQEYVGNTRAAADEARLDQSKAVTRAFIRDLVAVAGWAPNRVVLLLDGIRYPTSNPTVLNSYFVQMRTYLMAEATAAGFEVIDLDAHFFATHQAEGTRFEFLTDNHWNAFGHGVAADALLKSRVFSNCRLGMVRR